jgi:hypothetical protein
MTITERDILILEMLLTYGFLVTAQIRRELFPLDKDGSTCRFRLRPLEAAGMIRRLRAQVANPLSSTTMPVWTITQRGICQLTLARDDTRYLNQHSPCTRGWQNFAHYVAVSEEMIKLKKAVERQDRVQLGEMFFEHTVINAEADEPEKRYKLYQIMATLPRRIVCAADAAWEMQVDAYRRAYVLELERGTDSPSRIIAKKHKGHSLLSESKRYRLWFPKAQDMRVLFIAPTRSWCERLRKAARGTPAAGLYLFMPANELTADNFLSGDLVYTVAGEPRPLVLPAALLQRG